MVLRWVSRRRHCREGVMEPLVYGGVGMNFTPSPKMDLVTWGMMLPLVRSWNKVVFVNGRGVFSFSDE